MEHWYTLYTKPNAEYQVAHYLEQQGMHIYLPETESSPVARADRAARAGRAHQPFFPCYLFIKIDLEATGLGAVQWAPGLRRMVAFDEHPAAVPEAAIELIRDELETINVGGRRRASLAHGFRPGDKLRVTDGPLQGMLAIFDRSSTPGERVEVLLTFLGQVSRASVAAADLERAPPEAQAPQLRPPRRKRGKGRRIVDGEQRDSAPGASGS